MSWAVSRGMTQRSHICYTTLVGSNAEVKQLLVLSTPVGARQLTKIFSHRWHLQCWQQEFSTVIYQRYDVPISWYLS